MERWRGEALGGLAGALFVMPAVLGCGVIVFQPLGSAFQPLGIQAAFGATIAAALFRGLLPGGSLHVNAPRATQAALLGGLLVQATQAAAAGGYTIPAGVLVAIPVLALMVAALLQLLLGVLRMGDVLKFIPQPVVAGFVNGFALVILLQQLPNLLGLPDGAGAWAAVTGAAPVNPWALGFGLLAVVGVWFMGEKRSRVIPGPLLGLIVGTIAYQALAAVTEPGVLGATVKAPPAGMPFDFAFPGLAELATHRVFADLWPSLLVTGLTLGVVSSIQSLLSAAAADALLRVRHDASRELLAQGGANLLGALGSGTVTGGSPLYTRVAIHNGARSDRANLFLGLVLLGAAMGLGPVLEMVPVSVMAGVVVVAVLRPDDWTMQIVTLLLRRRAGAARAELLQTLFIVVVVAVLVAAVDVLVALAVGMALSVMVYLRRAAASVVRRSYHGDRVHSMTGRSGTDMDLLERHGRAIAVMELHGPVFFGSADNLARAAETLTAGGETLILDLTRVNDVESTGVLILRRLDERLAREGKTLLLSGLGAGRALRALLRDMGFDRPEAEGRVYGDLDTALSAAEDRLLARLSGLGAGAGAAEGEEEMALCDHPSLEGLTQAQFDLLSLTTRRLTFAPGERILSEGSTQNSQYFLVKGRVRVEKRSPGGGHSVRLGSICAGALFGEMAMLTGKPRSADVVADTAVVCHELAAEDVAMLDSLDPSISFILVRNIAREVTVKIGRMSRAATLSEA
ncbi:SulP family inorganic anion transporter [Azospirillum rugosum]|uniref:MFS superfamily sulfate permease-like transporter n=1 Tax=Azospirillum rugosum TaxID=416170 RepID=A0ABS4SG52_9PROT|nr:SulP family inorganic anion transporter [Azospirillum rugosum]MBP2291531.1 MFS superfamily sulfate permease-like transporter [Azospirillum rugosum]MDQ0525319.1 MFS superfamily sulfate permease-like transporter [Azospirillum rugosum]